MRILLTTASYPPSQNGVAYQVKLIKDELVRTGHKVMVLAPKNDKVSRKEKGVTYFPSIPNPIIPNDYPIGIPIVSFKKINNFNPQIIHSHHPIIVSGISKYLSQKHNSPLFFTHHTSYEQYADVYLPFGKDVAKKITRRVLIQLSKNTQLVICPSTRIQNHLNKIGIKNTILIPNGIDTSNFPHSTKKPRKLSLIYVGRLEREKSPEKLIKLAKSLRKVADFKLTIIGDGAQKELLEKAVSSSNLSKYVNILGSIPREKLSKLICSNHFFVSFSTTEVMPLTHLEALSAGLPILLPKNHGLDFINKDNSIYINPGLESAKKIYNTFSNTKRYNNLQDNTNKNTEKLSIRYSCKRLVKMYEKSLK